MQKFLLGIALCLALTLPAFAADPDVKLELKKNQVLVHNKGKTIPLPQDSFPAQPIADTEMFFVGIGEEDGEEYAVAPGLYIFKKSGNPVAFAPTDAETCSEVVFSPNGKILAMDAGTWFVRSWTFFSFPDMKPMGDTLYYMSEGKPSLVWAGNEGVLVSTLADEHKRTCDYDPCGPVSVEYYSFASAKSTKLLAGTDLCDYTLLGIEADGQTVTAQEQCLQSPEEWKTLPAGVPAKQTTAKLP